MEPDRYDVELSNDARAMLDNLSDGLADEGWRNTGAPEILRVFARGEVPESDIIRDCYVGGEFHLSEFLDELLDPTPATHERPRWYSYLDDDGADAENPELAALRFANRAEAAQFCLDHALYL